MRALSRLKDLISSERGNVLVVGAAVMPLLLASAAFAVDTIQLTVWKRQLQRAADSGAIAGAYAMAQNVHIGDAVEEDLAANSFPPLTEDEVVTPGERLGFKRTVRVQLRAAQRLPFMSIFTNRAANLTADATAAVDTGGTYCMIALDDDDSKPGIKVSGNSVVDLKCGMKTNARGSNTIDANGSKTKIIAEPVASAGGLEPGNFPAGTTLQPNSQPQKDPLAWLPNPTVPEGCNPGVLTVEGDVELNATEICYAGYNIKGKLTLTGTNVVMTANGGDISVQGQLVGASVTVVMTSPSGAAGSVKVTSADAELDLAAPTSGPYEGLLFYRDRRAGYADIKITGNSSLKLSGALYFPTADLSVSGNSDSSFNCLQMIGRKLSFSGGSASTNTCGNGDISNAFKLPIVRLIA